MADMNMPQKNGKRKVQAPRIDLTPMVDLGFLLITFFIFTTTMAQPKSMEVNMPFRPATDQPTEVPGESTITLIPTKEHTVGYYNAQFSNDSVVRKVKTAEIREVLLARQKEVATLPATFSPEAHKLHVIIKPNEDCTYEDVVSILDEMNILQVPYYAIDEITTEEQEWLRK